MPSKAIGAPGPQGRLEVSGTIDLSQFWPVRPSDADTVKVCVSDESDALQFRRRPDADPHITNVFRDATIIGAHGLRAPAIDARGRITVRLQGVDAPELHYRPQANRPPEERTAYQDRQFLKWNHDFRQPYGEEATLALTERLRLALGEGSTATPPPLLPCRIVTAVDHPDEVYDCYGRFVGDILVRDAGQDAFSWLNINHWLARHGWAIPTFYDSMSATEIRQLTCAASTARRRRRGLWRGYTSRIGELDWSLRYRGVGSHRTGTTALSHGPVILPKLFRRLATWSVCRRAALLRGSFYDYLASRHDPCHLIRAFMRTGADAPKHQLHKRITPQGQLRQSPIHLVFTEADSALRKSTGEPACAW